MQEWLNANTLFCSLIWGSVGFGFLIYGKKQREWVPMAGGVALIGISYLIPDWVWMSLACLALIAGMWYLIRQGA